MTEPTTTERSGPQAPIVGKGPRSPVPANGGSHTSPPSNGGRPEADTPRTPPEPRAELCPECGAPAEPGQAACLSCGSRIELPYRKPPGWRTPAAVVGSVAVLALLAGGLALREVTSEAIIESSRDRTASDEAVDVARAGRSATGVDAATPASPSSSKPPETNGPSTPKRARPDAARKRAQERASSSATPSAPSQPTASPSSKPKPEPKPEPRPGPKPATLRQWPAGASGWTVVLVARERRSAAEKRAREAVRAGIPAVGILRSEDYSSLDPGYWVAFAGRTSSRAKAEQLAERYARKGFGGAYPRFVEE